jgi:cytochrome c oxidase subunit I+III
MILTWLWRSDPEPVPAVDIGGGLRLPTYVSGPLSHAYWAVVILMLVLASLFLSYVFSYLYLWTVAPAAWPVMSDPRTVPLSHALPCAILLGLCSVALRLASHALARPVVFVALVLAAAGAATSAFLLDAAGHWHAGLRPDESGYAALVAMNAFLQLQVILPFVLIAAFAIARMLAGKLNPVRRVVFDTLALFGHYVVGQSLLGLAIIHGFPRLLA